MDKTLNITIKLDTALLREIRALAAEEKKSVSSLLAAYLRQIVQDRSEYAAAKRRALVRLSKGFDLKWKRPESRNEIHEREATVRDEQNQTAKG